VGWDNVPMHRWAQSQVFRSLSFLLSRRLRQPQANLGQDSLKLEELKAER
jgi:hypothetical protein